MFLILMYALAVLRVRERGEERDAVAAATAEQLQGDSLAGVLRDILDRSEGSQSQNQKQSQAPNVSVPTVDVSRSTYNDAPERARVARYLESLSAAEFSEEFPWVGPEGDGYLYYCECSADKRVGHRYNVASLVLETYLPGEDRWRRSPWRSVFSASSQMMLMRVGDTMDTLFALKRPAS